MIYINTVHYSRRMQPLENHTVGGKMCILNIEPNIICCDTDYVKKCSLGSFHCSYLKQYTRFMLGVKKLKRMCGLLWQNKTTILWTAKELTGNKIPYKFLRSGQQEKHKQQ